MIDRYMAMHDRTIAFYKANAEAFPFIATSWVLLADALHEKMKTRQMLEAQEEWNVEHDNA